jgi:GNAT superfamily N-acetyltransferase
VSRWVITAEPTARIPELAEVPARFTVDRVLDVTQQNGRVTLTERAVPGPWEKDYDALPGEGPAAWGERFDLREWGFLAARISGRCIGGAVVAPGPPAEGPWLMDLRVAPGHRRTGVGTALFAAAARWAAGRGFGRLRIETQNNNVAACRFYARQGCSLIAAIRDAYPSLPEEVQLIWHKSLSRQPEGVADAGQ